MEIISNNKTAVNTAEVEFKNSVDEFENALQAAYLKKRKNITIPGFRKGKATRKMIETQYGEGVFYDEAVNILYRENIDKVITETGLEVVDMPNIEVTKVEKEDGVTFKAVFTTKPEVNISDYKGIKATRIVNNVTDEDVDKELRNRQNRNARIVEVSDRAAEKGDTVVFDFEGFVDGKAFDGGKAEKYPLELGSGQFIPGFEDQIIGKNINEPFQVNVKFPADYTAEELRDKDAEFKCLIHEIKGKELPELDDEFAKDNDFDTLDEFKADIKKHLQEHAEEHADAKVETDLNEALIGKLEGEIPDVMYENRVTEMVRDWEFRNRYQGVTVQDFLKYTGQTMEQFRQNFREAAEKQIKLRLALEKIAQLESVEASSDDIEAEYKRLADEHKMEVEKVKRIIDEKSLSEDIKVEKAFKIVKDSAEIAS
ncbi:MAG: trigger factor [Firmicutes bacterium]|nr:trigger factor [[Eubacterium] siraeum]MCM1487477.1 trigger factor [Bacillota bacterium]